MLHRKATWLSRGPVTGRLPLGARVFLAVVVAMVAGAAGCSRSSTTNNTPAANAPAANTPANTPGENEQAGDGADGSEAGRTPGSATTGNAPAGSAPAGGATTASTSGQTLFAENCVRCHGAQGNTVSGWRKSVSSMSISQIEQTVRNGKDGMPSFSQTLSSQQIQAVAQYAKGLASGGASTAGGSSTPGAGGSAQDTGTSTQTAAGSSGASGAALYSSNCAGCHGKDGAQPPGWAAKVRGMSVAQIEQAVRKGASGMPGFASKLSKPQTTAVSQYTKSLTTK